MHYNFTFIFICIFLSRVSTDHDHMLLVRGTGREEGHFSSFPGQFFHKMKSLFPAVHVLVNSHWNLKALKDLTTDRH